ncbi:hypothetical protein, partial [Rhodococcus erythropolis]|uniref:hypothetical protein n=1 Tax=Rhodococcus erythropolis TaxID=1833 RepID=UPI001C40622B
TAATRDRIALPLRRNRTSRASSSPVAEIADAFSDQVNRPSHLRELALTAGLPEQCFRMTASYCLKCVLHTPAVLHASTTPLGKHEPSWRSIEIAPLSRINAPNGGNNYILSNHTVPLSAVVCGLIPFERQLISITNYILSQHFSCASDRIRSLHPNAVGLPSTP